MPKVLFLTTAHHYDDDRIFHHQAKELVSHGFEIKICSLTSDCKGIINGIHIECFDILHKSVSEKTDIFLKVCKEFRPDAVIASEPVAVFGARKYCKKTDCSLIYDITEWYPAMSMLRDYSGITKPFHAIKFLGIQILVGWFATHFIFGEKTKFFPLAYFFPFKKKLVLPYYPDQEFVQENIKTFDPKSIVLCCTGAISEDKGTGNFFKAANLLQERNPDIKIQILIIGAARNKQDEAYFYKLLAETLIKYVEIKEPTSFEKFTDSFAEADICFDLRSFNFENHHSLPIKLFYYMSAGKPIIYSALKGIRKHLDVSKFGFLVNPEDTLQIVENIEKYLQHPELYSQHAVSARKNFLEKYNWDKIRQTFTNFIRQSLPKPHS
jgi:glycosyltransferase involved in cell wall biosynthesis